MPILFARVPLLQGGEVVVGDKGGKRSLQIKYTLESEAPKAARDFFTHEEMASFKKKRRVKKKVCDPLLPPRSSFFSPPASPC